MFSLDEMQRHVAFVKENFIYLSAPVVAFFQFNGVKRYADSSSFEKDFILAVPRTTGLPEGRFCVHT